MSGVRRQDSLSVRRCAPLALHNSGDLSPRRQETVKDWMPALSPRSPTNCMRHVKVLRCNVFTLKLKETHRLRRNTVPGLAQSLQTRPPTLRTCDVNAICCPAAGERVRERGLKFARNARPLSLALSPETGARGLEKPLLRGLGDLAREAFPKTWNSI